MRGLDRIPEAWYTVYCILYLRTGFMESLPEQYGLKKIERRETLYELAYAQLKEAILSGKIAAGERFAEVQLASQLGMSKTPVRKAIARLEQEHLVVRDSRKGYRVAQVAPREVNEIYDLRRIIECYLVRETAGQFTREDVAEMEAAVRMAHEALAKGDNDAFARLNRPFHSVFDRKYGNSLISTLLDSLDERVRWILTSVFRADAQWLAASYAEHKEILDAVQAGDVEAVVSALEHHLDKFLMELPGIGEATEDASR